MKSKLSNVLTILAVVGIGVIGMVVLRATGPQSQRRQLQPMQTIVEVQRLVPTNAAVTVEGMGTVLPARELSLKSQVSGKVVEVSPNLLEGRSVQAGETLVRIEAADYQLAVDRAESTLAMRDSELAIEMGSQRVAKREWELLASEGDGIDPALALRQPQLKQAKAMRLSAQSALEQARLDLQRTQIEAPFNSVVISKSVEAGSLAGVNAEIARLVATDSFHVLVSIPESEVPALEIPGASASVCIRGSDTKLAGRVISLLSDLDPDGRMARVLVEVKDPLGILPENESKPRLLLGAYVEVILEGRPMPGAFEIPRSALHHGDVLWLMRANGTLEIRPVDVGWKNRETVLIRDGVEAGEALIITSLSFASDGMAVVAAGQPTEAEAGRTQSAGAGAGAGAGGVEASSR